MRILIPKRGDGTYVSGLEPHLLLETMAFAADVSYGHTAQQLLQVRRLLEPQVTALAAGRLTDDQLRALRAILDQRAANIRVEEFLKLDIESHRAIVDAVGNPVLSTLLGILSTHTQRLRIVRGTPSTPPPVSRPTASTRPSGGPWSTATHSAPPVPAQCTSPPWRTGWPPEPPPTRRASTPPTPCAVGRPDFASVIRQILEEDLDSRSGPWLPASNAHVRAANC